jgi:N-carbamoyl-L-amino-acid hydrolase
MWRVSLGRAAERLGLSVRELASGAGHDAAFMTRICSAAMIFTPCRAGKSHAPEEWVDRDALATGAAVMFETVCALDRAG